MTPQIPLTLNYNESPNCWIKVTYRKRDPLANCPNQDCEIEIQSIMISGDCFLPYTDNSTVPPTTYGPQLDVTDYTNISDYYRDIWTFGIFLWAESGLETCLTPTDVGDCKIIYHFKSASCKKLISNQNGDYELIYCDDFNSCCRESIKVCKLNDNYLECVWQAYPSADINNCYLNNDPSCTFTCYNYGESGWIPPKINFKEIELDKDVFFSFSNKKLNYNLMGKEYLCQITDIIGRQIFNGKLNGSGSINFDKNTSEMIIIKIIDNNYQKVFKILESK